jgi:Raf kinase inhibitor-like YbhB/YbcL family protein
MFIVLALSGDKTRELLLMRKSPLSAAVLMVALLVLVFATQAPAATMTLTSSAFANGGRIPDHYTLIDRTGKNISLPLTWSAPSGTLSFALSMVDHHPVADNWVHWLVDDIPAAVTSLPENASAKMPAGAVQLNNSWGEDKYWGPYPPQLTGLHPYVITVYALNVASLNLLQNTSLAEFEAAIQGKVVDSARITGYFRIGESSTAENMLLLQ